MARKYQTPTYSKDSKSSEIAWRESTIGRRGFFALDSSNPYYTTDVRSLSVQSVANVSGDIWRYTFEAAADLSEVSKGHILFIDSTTDFENTGEFRIVDFDNTAHTVDVINANGVAQVAAGGNGEIKHYPSTSAMVVDEDITFTSLIVEGQYGADISTTTIFAGSVLYGNILEAVVSGGSAKIYYF